MSVALFGMFTGSTIYFFYKFTRWHGATRIHVEPSARTDGPRSLRTQARLPGGPFCFHRRNQPFDLVATRQDSVKSELLSLAHPGRPGI